MAILQIRAQGFPELITRLGIVQPLQGPFWGFESTVIPTYKIGSLSTDTNASGLPYAPADFRQDTTLNPGAAVLITGPNMVRGRYAYQINVAWFNKTVTDSMLLWKIRDSGAATIRTTACQAISAQANNFGAGGTVYNFIEDMDTDHSFIWENLVALASADVRTSIRWLYLGPIPSYEQPS